MGHQLVFVGEPNKIKANHLVRAERWLFSRPQRNQHAGDDRTIRLELNPVLIVTQQMAAAQHVLEEPEEYLNRPALRVDQTDDFSRHIKQVGCDPQDAIAIGAA